MKKELTPTLLFVMQKVLEKWPKYEYVRVEAWSYPTKTLKMVLEVAMTNEKSSN
ncbi:unnamed protein product [marine sediment metagenome]|uniref:Uncharacterized protein n=1 Tax=marine sediment metagenome TaxID=412755 RepID=X1FAK7_9ZZZZ